MAKNGLNYSKIIYLSRHSFWTVHASPILVLIMKDHNYYIYILTNYSKSTLYTGVTNDLERRLIEHAENSRNDRKTFAGRYSCIYLIYYEWYMNIEEAIGREKQIKGWTRVKKEKMIASFNPDWRFLNDPEEIAKGDLPIWYINDDYWQPNSEEAIP